MVSGPYIQSDKSKRGDGINALQDICRIISMLTDLINYQQKRIVIVILRENKYNTLNDIICFGVENIQNNIYWIEYNELMWKLNTTLLFNKIIPNTEGAIIISNNIHSSNGSSRSYLRYNNYGARIFKRNIINICNLLSHDTLQKHTENVFLQNYKDLIDHRTIFIGLSKTSNLCPENQIQLNESPINYQPHMVHSVTIEYWHPLKHVFHDKLSCLTWF
eukprot:253318_1